jgi:hypothetical protein
MAQWVSPAEAIPMTHRFPRLISKLALAGLAVAAPLRTPAQDAGPMHAPDGQAPQLISPPYFPPKPNAPFTAVAKTLVVLTLPDGSTVTSQNERHVARDVDGRIFEERVTFVPVPDDGRRKMRVHATDYFDPVSHSWYHCDTAPKVCQLREYYEQFVEAPASPVGLQPDRRTYLTRENLGVDTFAGLDVQRSRETLTLATETVGNTRTILRTVDYWYSPALGVNVQVKRHDPRDGDQTLWLTDVSLSAPDPETFKIPADYTVVDHRHPQSVGEAQPASDAQSN